MGGRKDEGRGVMMARNSQHRYEFALLPGSGLHTIETW